MIRGKRVGPHYNLPVMLFYFQDLLWRGILYFYEVSKLNKALSEGNMNHFIKYKHVLILLNLHVQQGELARMVERALSMREERGTPVLHQLFF